MGESAAQTTVRVAELVCETKLDQIPREVVNYSKSLALSALGGMVSGAPIPNCKVVTRYVQRMGGNQEATVAASGFKTSVESAALANGHFAHTTEYEDDSMPEGVSAYTLFLPSSPWPRSWVPPAAVSSRPSQRATRFSPDWASTATTPVSVDI